MSQNDGKLPPGPSTIMQCNNFRESDETESTSKTNALLDIMDEDEDLLISQAYDDLLLDGENDACKKATKNPDGENDACKEATKNPDGENDACKEATKNQQPVPPINNYLEDLVTLEDLIGPVSGLFNELPESLHDQHDPIEDLSEASTLGTILVMEVFERSWQMITERRISSETIAIIVSDLFNRTWKIIKPRSHWRASDPSSWKKNILKKRRADGLPYVTAKKSRKAKVPKQVDCSNCQYRCTTKITQSQRENLCREYWSENYAGKKNFIIQLTEVLQSQTIKLNRKRATARSHTKKHFFHVAEGKIPVCQNFFCKTLSISQSVVADAIKNRNEFGTSSSKSDPRGRRSPPNKTQPQKIQEVRDHISSFPTMKSHYVRKDIQRQYLDCKLSINKMYQLYTDKCTEKGTTPVSESIYRKIFSTEFNLGFFTPKKDLCLICTKYDRLEGNAEKRGEMEEEYRQHIERKKTCNQEKLNDKERAVKDKTFLSASFDLQAILQIPSGDVGLLYYTRKLTIYNLTIYESALPNDAYCFAWTETNGKKGSSEIGSILHHYLSQCIGRDVVEVSLFSDTCGGQNRNQYVAALLLWSVNNIENLQVIEHKFLESGHSYMEVDSMHSSIENAHKYTAVYSMTEWLNIFRRARSSKCKKKGVSKKPYEVKEMKFNDFKDLKELAAHLYLNKRLNTTGQKVMWLKIKRMKYVKGELKIYYNYDMSQNFHVIDLSFSDDQQNYCTRKRGHKQTSERTGFVYKKLTPLYTEVLPISIAKKANLINLCDKGVIPDEYHGWYQKLKTDEDCEDILPCSTVSDPSDIEDSEETEEYSELEDNSEEEYLYSFP